MSRVYWVCARTRREDIIYLHQACVRTAEEALKLGREWHDSGKLFPVVWVHDASRRLSEGQWCCYRELMSRGRWRNPRRGWVCRAPLTMCPCGIAAHTGHYCKACLDAETSTVSGEELGAASAVLDRARRPSIVMVCPECGPLPHGPSCHQGDRQ